MNLDNYTLEDYLLIAKIAIEYTKSIITFGSPNRNDSKVNSSAILALRSEFNKYDKLNKNKSSFEKLNSKVEVISKYKFGNCYEHTILAYYYIIRNFNVRACTIDLANIDHSVLLIGSIGCTDFHKWDDSTVVCDPWDSKYYPARYAFIFLKPTFGFIMNFAINKVHRVPQNKIPKNNLRVLVIDSDERTEIKNKILLSRSYDFVGNYKNYPAKYFALFVISSTIGCSICSIVKGKLESNLSINTLLLSLFFAFGYIVSSLVHNEIKTKELMSTFTVEYQQNSAMKPNCFLK